MGRDWARGHGAQAGRNYAWQNVSFGPNHSPTDGTPKCARGVRVVMAQNKVAPTGFPQKEVFLLCKNRRNPPLQVQRVTAASGMGFLRHVGAAVQIMRSLIFSPVAQQRANVGLMHGEALSIALWCPPAPSSEQFDQQHSHKAPQFGG
jgi:hypothetical protein